MVSPYNVYGWQSFEVSKDSDNKAFTNLKFQFNLPDIRHQADEMQIYIDNDSNVKIEIEKMTITATSLIRK